jgi:hypothetical protein
MNRHLSCSFTSRKLPFFQLVGFLEKLILLGRKSEKDEDSKTW